MSIIKKVALVGASGNLGPIVLEHLLQAQFQVTILTRQGSKNIYPTGVTISEVDYDSSHSLIAALRGQDAVVSTIASEALSKQLKLVEAAAEAGVTRFIPSEFGSNTPHPKTSQLPCFGPKVEVQNKLKETAAKDGGMTWTVICTGAFFDWGMKVGFIMNPASKSVTLYDGGERLFSASTLSTIGKAVTSVLQHPQETQNRAVYVQSTAISLKKLANIGKKVTGTNNWKEETVAIDDLVAQGWEELGKANPNPANFVYNFIKASIWGEGYGMPFERLDNELLGIKEMDEEEIERLVASLV